jgi:hypothetical protein
VATIVKGKNARKPWTVRYWHEGRQRERSFVTKGEADDFIAKFEHDRRAQIFTDPALGNISFREYAERWFRQHTGSRNTIDG